jgi:hypothetical protein
LARNTFLGILGKEGYDRASNTYQKGEFLMTIDKISAVTPDNQSRHCSSEKPATLFYQRMEKAAQHQGDGQDNYPIDQLTTALELLKQMFPQPTADGWEQFKKLVQDFSALPKQALHESIGQTLHFKQKCEKIYKKYTEAGYKDESIQKEVASGLTGGMNDSGQTSDDSSEFRRMIRIILQTDIPGGSAIRECAKNLVLAECADNMITQVPIRQQISYTREYEHWAYLSDKEGNIMEGIEGPRHVAIIVFRNETHNNLIRLYGLRYTKEVEKTRTAIYNEVLDALLSKGWIELRPT